VPITHLSSRANQIAAHLLRSRKLYNSPQMATFVLVHGAGGGGFSWQALAGLLRSAGHLVYSPSLTGYGDREHLSGPQVNLSMHTQDIVNLIEMEDLRDIVLVGHSYGGMVITGVADRVPERIAHLVYEDAMLPRDRESAMDIGNSVGASDPRAALVDGWKLPFPAPPAMTPEEEERNRKFRPVPVGTLEEKVRLRVPLEQEAFTRTYVKAAANPNDPRGTGNFWRAADMVRDNPAWRYYELPCGHGVHRELPHVMAGILLELAASKPASL
jgi:pimeloyl-ACP methyl ester carboxylesterase